MIWALVPVLLISCVTLGRPLNLYEAVFKCEVIMILPWLPHRTERRAKWGSAGSVIVYRVLAER